MRVLESFTVKNALTDRMYREVTFEEIYQEELRVPLQADIPDREVNRMYEVAEAIAKKQGQPMGAKLVCMCKETSRGNRCSVYLYTWSWAYGL